MMSHVKGTGTFARPHPDPLRAAVFLAEREHRKAIKRAELASPEHREKAWELVDRAYEHFAATVHALGDGSRKGAA